MKKQHENTLIVDRIYPIIAKAMDKNTNRYKQMLNLFFEKRSADLYDTCPCSRIYFGEEDFNNFYKSTGIDSKEIKNILQNVYYYNEPNFNARAAKNEFTVINLMIIRYFYLKKKKKETELATIYLAFSGYFYPSIHSIFFPKFQPSEYRYIMEYVVNNLLSNKFDLKTEKNIICAIRSKSITWLNTYEDKLKDCDDEDVVYLIQQFHNRLKSFMKNIAKLYYKTYENKDAYFVYDSDNLSEDNYHIADNDSLKIERAVEKSMSTINSKSIDYRLCKISSDNNVRTDELKNIVESITSDQTALSDIKELIRLITTQYFIESKDKDLRNLSFISKSIVLRPNSKDKNILRQREIVENLLTLNSSAYNRRKSRYATKSSYQKCLMTYFILIIYNSNK